MSIASKLNDAFHDLDSLKSKLAIEPGLVESYVSIFVGQNEQLADELGMFLGEIKTPLANGEVKQVMATLDLMAELAYLESDDYIQGRNLWRDRVTGALVPGPKGTVRTLGYVYKVPEASDAVEDAEACVSVERHFDPALKPGGVLTYNLRRYTKLAVTFMVTDPHGAGPGPHREVRFSFARMQRDGHPLTRLFAREMGLSVVSLELPSLPGDPGLPKKKAGELDETREIDADLKVEFRGAKKALVCVLNLRVANQISDFEVMDAREEVARRLQLYPD
jgi:hypothetical protein